MRIFNIDVIGLQVLQVVDVEARMEGWTLRWFCFCFWLGPMTCSMWDPQEPQPLQRSLESNHWTARGGVDCKLSEDCYCTEGGAPNPCTVQGQLYFYKHTGVDREAKIWRSRWDQALKSFLSKKTVYLESDKTKRLELGPSELSVSDQRNKWGKQGFRLFVPIQFGDDSSLQW